MSNEVTICEIQAMIRAIERLNGNCQDNMKRLNDMMNELKGLIAMVRPLAKKNDWYGAELEAKEMKRVNFDVKYLDDVKPLYKEES